MANPRLSVIDESNISDHAALHGTDQCYFLFEYTSGRGYDFSATNQLISNLKKKPSTQTSNPQAYKYKGRSIRSCGAWLGQALNAEWLKTGTLVPIPPSKAKSHPDYDDRMLQICRTIPSATPLDIREMVIQRESMRAAHECGEGERPTIEEIAANYMINEDAAAPEPKAIAIVDDVLTAGRHFKAMQRVLRNRFPEAVLLGLFIARRVFPNDLEIEEAL